MNDPLDTAAIQETIRATAPKKPSLWQRPLFAAAVIGICLTVMALVSNLALYQWGSSKSNEVEDLRAESQCRSFIAAETDVAQGEFLADLGGTQLITARALAAVGTSDRAELTSLVTQLVYTSDELEQSLDAYLTQLDARANTSETCG